jgi:hypothetical protein
VGWVRYGWIKPAGDFGGNSREADHALNAETSPGLAGGTKTPGEKSSLAYPKI